MSAKAGRNDLCPCGSRKKFKRCCEAKTRSSRGSKVLVIVVSAVVLGGVAAAFTAWTNDEVPSTAPGRVWSPEHGHYH
jgi:hypothetical protein